MHRVGTQDLDLLVRGGKADRDLHHAGVQAARIGIDLLENVELGAESRAGHRVRVGIEPLIRRRRGVRPRAAALTHGQAGGFAGAQQRRFGDFRGMGVACDLAAHRAQAEAFGCVIAGGFHAAIVKEQHFRTFALQEQLTVIRPRRGIAQDPQCGLLVDLGLEGAERGRSRHGAGTFRG